MSLRRGMVPFNLHEAFVGVNEGIVLQVLEPQVLAFEAIVYHPSKKAVPTSL